MSVYRDDLNAARERIRSLEGELQSLQRREASQGKESQDKNRKSELARLGASHSSTLFVFTGAVVVAFVALRVPVIAPIAAVLVLVTLLLHVLRGRIIAVRPNEVAVIRPKHDALASSALWIGPGRVARLDRAANVELLSMRAHPISFTAIDVATKDAHVDIDVFAVVAIRRDDDGIERAIRSFGSKPITAIAQAAIEDALRRTSRDASSDRIEKRDAEVRERLRRLGRECLDELGAKLVVVGIMETRASRTQKDAP